MDGSPLLLPRGRETQEAVNRDNGGGRKGRYVCGGSERRRKPELGHNRLSLNSDKQPHTTDDAIP